MADGKTIPPDRDLKRIAQFESYLMPRQFIELYADKHGAVLRTTLPDGREYEWPGSLVGKSRED